MNTDYVHGGPDARVPVAVMAGLHAADTWSRGAGHGALHHGGVPRCRPEAVLLWAVFVSVVVSGAITALQAVHAWRFGAGYLIPTGTSAAAIAVAVVTLEAGGPALLAALVLALAIFQFVVASRLALFRHILTPTVTGTIIMLVPVTVMPVIFEQLGDVPEAKARRLLVTARREDGGATLEFVAAPGENNLQDRIALLGEADTSEALEREVSHDGAASKRQRRIPTPRPAGNPRVLPRRHGPRQATGEGPQFAPANCRRALPRAAGAPISSRRFCAAAALVGVHAANPGQNAGFVVKVAVGRLDGLNTHFAA